MELFRPLAGASCVLLLVACSSVLADSKIYKYRLPDGSVLYSQGESARGNLEDVLTVRSPSPARVAQAQRELADTRAAAQRLGTERERRPLIPTWLRQAEQDLDQAEAALRSGMRPLAGERQAIINGNSRLTDAYWERMRMLRQSVEDARARLKLALEEYAALSRPPVADSSGR